MKRLLAAVILIGFTLQAAAQSRPDEFDPIRFEPGQNEIVISDIGQLPRQLARAIERPGCRYAEMLRSDPIRIVRAAPPSGGRYVFAIVTCAGVPYLPMQILEFGDIRREPRPLYLPVMANGGGFGATPYAGALRWDAASLTLTATHGSDMCPSPAVRYRYALGNRMGYSVGETRFNLVRIDWLRDHRSGEKDWQLLWEATAWPFSIP